MLGDEPLAAQLLPNRGKRFALRVAQIVRGSYRHDGTRPGEWFCGRDGARIPAHTPGHLEPSDANAYGWHWDRFGVPDRTRIP